MRARAVAIALLSAACVARLEAAQDPGPPALTPGGIVLLANSQDPTATETLRRALVDPQPLVRRAAARVASVGHPDVFGTLLRALGDERDARVLAEFVKDIMALAGPKAAPLVASAVTRGGSDATVEMAEWFARMAPDEFAARLAQWHDARGAERLSRLVALAARRHPDKAAQILDAWKPLASEKAWTRVSDPKTRDAALTGMRTIDGLATEVLASTLAAAKCAPNPGTLATATTTYGADGRPTAIDADPEGLTVPCRDAVVALARISTEPDNSVPGPQSLIVPLTPTFTACAAAPPGPADSGPDPLLGREMESPRLKREVKPDYNRAGFGRKLEGVVELVAVVSTTGCVQRAGVIRSLDVLDIQAMKALLEWRFTPGTARGVPVNMIVNIELTFTFRGK